MKYVMSHLYLVCKMNKENEMEYILFLMLDICLK